MITKKLPYNILAEESLLGSLIADDRIASELTHLRPEDFYLLKHQIMFRACMALHYRRVRLNFTTIIDELKSMKRLSDVGGEAWVREMTRYMPSARYFRRHAKKVEHDSILRQMLAKSQEMAMLALNADEDQDIGEVLMEFEAMAFSVREERRKVHKTVSVGELVDSVYARYKQAYERANSKGTRYGGG